MTKIIEFFKGLFSGWNNPPPPSYLTAGRGRIGLFNGRLHIISRNDVKAKYQSF